MCTRLASWNTVVGPSGVPAGPSSTSQPASVRRAVSAARSSTALLLGACDRAGKSQNFAFQWDGLTLDTVSGEGRVNYIHGACDAFERVEGRPRGNFLAVTVLPGASTPAGSSVTPAANSAVGASHSIRAC